MKQLFLAMILLLPVALHGQKKVTIKDMQFSYELKGTTVEIELNAPTLGWVGVGFNDHNSIVNSDLYLLRVKKSKVEGLDMFVVSAGNPKEDIELRGSNNIEVIEGSESSGSTRIKFSVPMDSKDPNDYKHKLNQDFWLILAYSQSDDFDHHSIMRKHIKYRFTR